MRQPSTLSKQFHQAFLRGIILLMFCIIVMNAGCESISEEIVDISVAPPLLHQVQLIPAAINTDTISVGSVRNPDDLLILSPLLRASLANSSGSGTSVQYTIRRTFAEAPISTGEIHDNGVLPDVQRGDGIFSGTASFTIKRSEVGTFLIECMAVSSEGLRSSSTILPLSVYRSNKPPVLSGLIAPDTIKLLNQTQLFLLAVKVTDPDGQSDLQRVFFNSFKPDGSGSSGNPFKLYDDGSDTILFPPDGKSGDQVKGDGVFSLMISMPATTTTGTYRFEFQAFDRSNEASNILIHRITVRQ